MTSFPRPPGGFGSVLPSCFADVNVAFQRAAHKVLLDDDNLLPLLHLTVDYQGKDKGEAAAALCSVWWVGCCCHLVA